MSAKQPTEETSTEEETTWGEQPPETSEKTGKIAPSKTEAPLFKLLREIKEAILSKEQQRAHHLDRIATALEKLANLPTVKTPVTTAPPKTPKTPATPPTQTPAPTPAPVSVIDKVKGYFPENLLALLKFEDLGEYIKVAPRQYLGSENFAKIASIIRDNGGEYISAGKDSHFRIRK